MMRWLFGRWETKPQPGANEGKQEAEKELIKAKERMACTVAQQPQVEEAVTESKRLLARNHFGDDIEQALRRRILP